MTLKKKSSAILFDLDGTLLDTANDLTSAINTLLKKHKLNPLSLSQTRALAGKGSKGFIKMGFNIEPTHSDFQSLSNEFFENYATHLIETTNLFPGMENVIQYLENKQIPWGIVTNKPARFTDVLISKIPSLNRAHCVVSGDTLTQRKPHPDPILHACKLLKCEPSECIYVGDAEIDIIASQSAGTLSLVALYGYIHADETPLNWKADGYINSPDEILNWV